MLCWLNKMYLQAEFRGTTPFDFCPSSFLSPNIVVGEHLGAEAVLSASERLGHHGKACRNALVGRGLHNPGLGCPGWRQRRTLPEGSVGLQIFPHLRQARQNTVRALHQYLSISSLLSTPYHNPNSIKVGPSLLSRTIVSTWVSEDDRSKLKTISWEFSLAKQIKVSPVASAWTVSNEQILCFLFLTKKLPKKEGCKIYLT